MLTDAGEEQTKETLACSCLNDNAVRPQRFQEMLSDAVFANGDD